MAENDSTEERTEEPTAKRLEKARSEGRVARSQELSVAAMLIGTSIFLYFMGGYFVKSLAEEFAAGFVFDRKLVFSDNIVLENLISLGLKSFFIIIPIFVLTFIIATIAAGAIGGFVLSFEALAPKLSKINPLEGVKRIFGLRALIELVKALAKFLLIGGVLVFVISTSLDSLIELGFKGLKPALSEAGGVIATGMLWVTIPLIIVASIDVPYQVFEYKKKLKMTKQEIKDELKETEGRPEVRAQIRRKQREMAMGRMIDAVAEADVIITNPSEFAVALSYNPGTEEAPQLIAKGVDLIAGQIRDKAKENGVPVFASPLLARALYFTTEVNDHIPESLYYAVAQVIAYVFNLQSVNVNRNQIDKPNPEVPKEYHFDPSGKQLN